MKSVAVVCWKNPFPIRGGLDLRIDGICRALANSCELTLVCMEGNGDHKPDYLIEILVAPPERYVLNHEVLRWGIENPSDPFGVFVTEERINFLNKCLESKKFDSIIVSRIMTWRLFLEASFSSDVQKIFDLDESTLRLRDSFQEAISYGPSIKFIAKFHDRNFEFEKLALSQADHILVSSELEKKSCLETNPILNISVIENVVYLPPVDRVLTESQKRVLLPGNFDYPPNREAMKEIIGEIAPQLIDFNFIFAGSGLKDEMKVKSINVHFNVAPDDMSQVFDSVDYLIAPIRFGAGTRLKILEALSHGVLVIATKFAVEGLELVPYIHFIPAETPEEFINLLQIMDSNQSLRQEIIFNGKRHVQSRFTPEVIAGKLEKILGSNF